MEAVHAMVKEGLLRPITPDQVHTTVASSTFHKKPTRQFGGGDQQSSRGMNTSPTLQRRAEVPAVHATGVCLPHPRQRGSISS